MPIVREPDGLAMSSRNAYLSPDQRENAIARELVDRSIVQLHRVLHPLETALDEFVGGLLTQGFGNGRMPDRVREQHRHHAALSLDDRLRTIARRCTFRRRGAPRRSGGRRYRSPARIAEFCLGTKRRAARPTHRGQRRPALRAELRFIAIVMTTGTTVHRRYSTSADALVSRGTVDPGTPGQRVHQSTGIVLGIQPCSRAYIGN